ncbi:MAG: hypothetical protein K0R34_2883 [Herbinix sp.]|nr:hypothetical protein [Herbinix sp.]
MPKVKNVEKRIFDIEGFEVIIRGQDKKDKRGDADLSRQYEADRMTRNSFSVGDWKEKFKKQFVGMEVDILKGDGSKASGQTKLSTVRDTYLEVE